MNISKPIVHYLGQPHYWMWDAKNEVADLEVVLDHPYRVGNEVCCNAKI